MSTYFLSLVKYIHVWVTITADGMKYLECGGKAASVTHMADLQYIRENVKLHNMGKRNRLAMLAMAITPQVYPVHNYVCVKLNECFHCLPFVASLYLSSQSVPVAHLR